MKMQSRLIQQDHAVFEFSSGLVHEHEVEGEEPLETFRTILKPDECGILQPLDEGHELVSISAELHLVAHLAPVAFDFPVKRRLSVAQIILPLLACGLIRVPSLFVLVLKIQFGEREDRHECLVGWMEVVPILALLYDIELRSTAERLVLIHIHERWEVLYDEIVRL